MQNINRDGGAQDPTTQTQSGDPRVSELILGNRWQQEERWQDAIQAYAAALRATPLIGLPVVYLLEVTQRRYLRERSLLLRKEPDAARLVAVIDKGMDTKGTTSHNPYGKHQTNQLIMPRGTSDLAGWTWQQVVSMPADGVVLQGISMPLVLAGLFYKLIWGSAVWVTESTADDHREPLHENRGSPGEEANEEASQQSLTAITIDQLKRKRGGIPDPQNLQQIEWLQLALELATRFDGRLPSTNHEQWPNIQRQPRRPVDGNQLTSLEALAPALASPLMAARFWRWSQERINWAELQSKRRDTELVSIVIPVYGDPRELDACLFSLREAECKWQWEVIAVMNDASDESIKVLTSHQMVDTRIRSVWPGENVQFALGCNLGFAASRGRWIVLLNNDCRVSNGWLDGLIHPLENEDVAATQPRLLKPDGTVQSLGVVFKEGQTLGYPLYAGLPMHLPCVQAAHKLKALTGACLAMRAQDYASVQGLDCRYINSQEDIDLCLRLLKIRGRRYCLSSQDSEVVHGEGRAPGRYSHSIWSRHQFALRWAKRIEADDQSVYNNDGTVVNTFKRDKPELEREGIGAGRAVVIPSPTKC
jgi:GT2 family glycosyltransferase